MSKFRDFLYLDGGTIESLLAGVEGGSYDSVDERWRHSDRARSLMGDAGESDASEDMTTATATEHRRKMRQNAEARFTRLWEMVDKDEAETVLDEDSKVSDLMKLGKVGTFCKFTGRLSVPAILAVLNNATELHAVARMLEQFGAMPPGAEEASTKLEILGNAKDLLSESFPVSLDIDVHGPKVILPLNPQNSRISINQFVGRATIFGRIIDTVEQNSSYPLLHLPGAAHFPQMSRQQRRQAERNKKSSSEAPMEVKGPALVIKPVAIYQ